MDVSPLGHREVAERDLSCVLFQGTLSFIDIGFTDCEVVLMSINRNSSTL